MDNIEYERSDLEPTTDQELRNNNVSETETQVTIDAHNEVQNGNKKDPELNFETPERTVAITDTAPKVKVFREAVKE